MSVYNQLGLSERETIYNLKGQSMSVKAIAECLNRHKSTIYRELKRNVDKVLGYLPDRANNMSQERKAKHGHKLDRYPDLKKKVIEQLKEGWSPEIIAGRMKTEQQKVNICKETIYQFIYSDEGHRLDLYTYLDRSRPRRGMKKGRKPRSIPNRISIHDRPKEIDSREELGHLEGDLIINQGSMSANVAVVIERKTRLVRLIKNDNKQSTTVMQGIFNKVASLPPKARKTMTFDNGTEFAKHGVMETIDMKTYFCDPYSPWQKGQVERVNRSIRRYIPKSIPFKDLSLKELALVEEKLNNLPRKCLGFKTPMEMFKQEIVALRA